MAAAVLGMGWLGWGGEGVVTVVGWMLNGEWRCTGARDGEPLVVCWGERRYASSY